MSARARLQLGEQVAHVGLYGLLREEELLADLPVDEALRDQLEHLDLPGRGQLHALPRRERDHLAGAGRGPALGDGVEPP